MNNQEKTTSKTNNHKKDDSYSNNKTIYSSTRNECNEHSGSDKENIECEGCNLDMKGRIISQRIGCINNTEGNYENLGRYLPEASKNKVQVAMKEKNSSQDKISKFELQNMEEIETTKLGENHFIKNTHFQVKDLKQHETTSLHENFLRPRTTHIRPHKTTTSSIFASKNNSSSMLANNHLIDETLSSSLLNLNTNSAVIKKDSKLISSIFNLQSNNSETVLELHSKDNTRSNNIMTTRIVTCIRKKPVDSKHDLITCNNNIITVEEPRCKLDLTKYINFKSYAFDHCYSELSNNLDIFNDMDGLYKSVIGGIDGSVIMYGQTGTGKTHTLFNSGDGLIYLFINKMLKELFTHKNKQEEDFGKIILNEGVMNNTSMNNASMNNASMNNASMSNASMSNASMSNASMNNASMSNASKNNASMSNSSTNNSSTNNTLSVMFYEIYNNQVYDLFNCREKLNLYETNGTIQVINPTIHDIRQISDLTPYINEALQLRRGGQTKSNPNSSRSHAIFKVTITNTAKLKSSLLFIDLAGSERSSDRNMKDARVNQEGAEINKSLLALKECIRGIDNKRKHLPFRQSKLTKLLKPLLVGESLTYIVGTVNPGLECIEHTINTLNYMDMIKDKKCIDGISPYKTHALNTLKYKDTVKNNECVYGMPPCDKSRNIMHWDKILIPDSCLGDESIPNSSGTYYNDGSMNTIVMGDTTRLENLSDENIKKYFKQKVINDYGKDKFDHLIFNANDSHVLSQSVSDDNLIIICNKKIQTLCHKITNKCENSTDVKMLRKTKNILEKICNEM